MKRHFNINNKLRSIQKFTCLITVTGAALTFIFLLRWCLGAFRVTIFIRRSRNLIMRRYKETYFLPFFSATFSKSLSRRASSFISTSLISSFLVSFSLVVSFLLGLLSRFSWKILFTNIFKIYTYSFFLPLLTSTSASLTIFSIFFFLTILGS